MSRRGRLVLEDGSEYPGTLFGAEVPTAGEVVFNTGMVGYPETLTDPSYCGQILVVTFPYVGNYGVPGASVDVLGLPAGPESERIWISGLVVVNLSSDTHHWSAERSLHEWLESESVPGLQGVDTWALAARIRDRGAMLANLVPNGEETDWHDPNLQNLVAEVSTPEVVTYGDDRPRVVMPDTGAKANIVAMISVRLRLPIRRVLLSTGNVESKAAFLKNTRELAATGVRFYGTPGTAAFMEANGVPVTAVNWPLEGASPTAVDLIRSAGVDLVVNIPKDASEEELKNDYMIRRAAVDCAVPLITNLQLAQGLVQALCRKSLEDLEIKSWQEY